MTTQRQPYVMLSLCRFSFCCLPNFSENVVLLFYDGCKRTWTRILKNEIEFVTYDADDHKEIMTKYNIQGFPTLILNAGDKAIEYNGERDINSLKEFINSYK